MIVFLKFNSIESIEKYFVMCVPNLVIMLLVENVFLINDVKEESIGEKPRLRLWVCLAGGCSRSIMQPIPEFRSTKEKRS